jgi:hypothetical protein
MTIAQQHIISRREPIFLIVQILHYEFFDEWPSSIRSKTRWNVYFGNSRPWECDQLNRREHEAQ